VGDRGRGEVGAAITLIWGCWLGGIAALENFISPGIGGEFYKGRLSWD